MTPVEQTVYGAVLNNSLTACVASVLDLPIDALPEFCADDEWFARLHQFCVENGFSLLYWKHSETLPVLCLNCYVIVLLTLDGTPGFHAVVAKATVKAKTKQASGDIHWSWQAEIVHDPSRRGTPLVKEVSGYLYVGRC